jgi:hypothetical protein
MSAFDGGDWMNYVLGHDPEELHVIADPEDLTYEKLWMRPIPASRCEEFGLFDDACDDTVLRDRATGRFTARIVWMECREDDTDAVPYMGCRYRPEVLS